jgi:hypothetical protein
LPEPKVGPGCAKTGKARFVDQAGTLVPAITKSPIAQSPIQISPRGTAVGSLLDSYTPQIAADFGAALPMTDSPAH